MYIFLDKICSLMYYHMCFVVDTQIITLHNLKFNTKIKFTCFKEVYNYGKKNTNLY